MIDEQTTVTAILKADILFVQYPEIDLRAYLKERRRALLQEVNSIEMFLGEPLTVRAECPQCKIRFNKKAG